MTSTIAVRIAYHEGHRESAAFMHMSGYLEALGDNYARVSVPNFGSVICKPEWLRVTGEYEGERPLMYQRKLRKA